MKKKKKNTKKRITRKQNLNLEKLVFAVVLWTIGVVVVSLLSMTIFQGPASAVVGTRLETTMIQNGSSVGLSSADFAKNLVVGGALGLCVLGFAIFLGLKIKDHFF